jgi:hypothetical protein
MISNMPPRWLERLLLLTLSPRNRETVSGDILEEYREEQLPRRGEVLANLWYLRQVAGFALICIFGGPKLKKVLACMCLFVAAAGIWLAVKTSSATMAISSDQPSPPASPFRAWLP